MDKNSITGLLLIAAIMFGFFIQSNNALETVGFDSILHFFIQLQRTAGYAAITAANKNFSSLTVCDSCIFLL